MILMSPVQKRLVLHTLCVYPQSHQCIPYLPVYPLPANASLTRQWPPYLECVSPPCGYLSDLKAVRFFFYSLC